MVAHPLISLPSLFLYGLNNTSKPLSTHSAGRTNPFTVVADIQSPVVETYDEVSKLSWLGSSLPLGGVAVILTLGKAYGTFNNKYLYLASITIFAAGSAVCGATPSMDVLIVGRVIVGLGAPGMYLGALNLLLS
jgi:MFS family permease